MWICWRLYFTSSPCPSCLAAPPPPLHFSIHAAREIEKCCIKDWQATLKLTEKKNIQTWNPTLSLSQACIIAPPPSPPRVVSLALSSTKLGIPDVLPKAKCGEKWTVNRACETSGYRVACTHSTLNIYKKKKRNCPQIITRKTHQGCRDPTPPPPPFMDLNDSSSEEKRISILVENEGKEGRVFRVVPYLKFLSMLEWWTFKLLWYARK